MSEADLETRLRRLEQLAFEGDSLSGEVTRLQASVATLGEVLLQVDRQQQTLTRLGQDLEKVEKSTVPRQELEVREDKVRMELRAYRKRLLGRVYAAGVTAVALVLGLVLGGLNYAEGLTDFRIETYALCMERQKNAEAINEFLDQREPVIDTLPAEERPAARDQLELLRTAFPVVACDGLAP